MTDAELAAIRAAVHEAAMAEAPPPWFKRWCEEVFERTLANQQATRNTAAGALKDERAREATSDDERWRKNDEAHEIILQRLGALNGFKNKVMGVSTFVVFCGPLAVAIWALLTR